MPLKDNLAVANSRDVAAYFGKAHSVVLRKIADQLTELPPEALNNFVETPELNEQNGQTYRSFDMTKDGFTLLAMGFTGKKALLLYRRGEFLSGSYGGTVSTSRARRARTAIEGSINK